MYYLYVGERKELKGFVFVASLNVDNAYRRLSTGGVYRFDKHELTPTNIDKPQVGDCIVLSNTGSKLRRLKEWWDVHSIKDDTIGEYAIVHNTNIDKNTYIKIGRVNGFYLGKYSERENFTIVKRELPKVPKITVGSKVRVKAGVEPRAGWGSVKRDDVGVIREFKDTYCRLTAGLDNLKGTEVVIDFPRQRFWKGFIDELEIVDENGVAYVPDMEIKPPKKELRVGSKVRIKAGGKYKDGDFMNPLDQTGEAVELNGKEAIVQWGIVDNVYNVKELELV
jgi:hypothetical protein